MKSLLSAKRNDDVPPLVGRAIDFADEEQNDGSPYSLMIGFVNGTDLEFDVAVSNGRHVLRYHRSQDVAFLNPDQIVIVRVNWL